MGLCRKCGISVDEGQDLCGNCKKAEIPESENQETYLDDLLNHMVSTQSEQRTNLSRSSEAVNGSAGTESIMDNKRKKKEYLDIDLEDLFSTDEIDLPEDLFELEEDDFIDFNSDLEIEEELLEHPGIENQIKEEVEEAELEKPWSLSEEDVDFAEDLGFEPDSGEEKSKEKRGEAETESSVGDITDFESEPGEEDTEDILHASEDTDAEESLDLFGAMDVPESPDYIEDASEDERNRNLSEPEEFAVGDEEPEEDLLSLLGMMDAEEEDPGIEEESEKESVEEGQENEKDEEEEIDDLLSLLGEDKEEPESAEEDVFSLDDFITEENQEDGPEGEDNEVSSDFADILSESLSAVSSENQEETDKMEELTQILQEDTKKKKDKKGIKDIFAKLFSNIHDDKAKKEQEEEEAQEKVKEAKKEAKKAAKDKKAKGPEGKEGGAEGEEGEESKDKKKDKKDKKAKKEKKPKEKKVKEVAEEEEEKDEGRINRIGAAVIFTFFAAVTIALVLGTNSFNYNLSIKNATEYFAIRKYTKAYNEVSGIDIKKKDIEIYDKIKTVMYVNKQLNSYNNYYALKLYPEALDSLLKGMERYDKYIALAEEMGIVSDLDYVRSQIMAELSNTYNLSEEIAYDIINTKSLEDYSQKVVQAAVLE